MSEDIINPIPDSPGQDPDAVVDEPFTDSHGLSDSPHPGYEEEMEADGVGVPGQDRVDEGEAPPADRP
jgi:hypothetical protein